MTRSRQRHRRRTVIPAVAAALVMAVTGLVLAVVSHQGGWVAVMAALSAACAMVFIHEALPRRAPYTGRHAPAGCAVPVTASSAPASSAPASSARETP